MMRNGVFGNRKDVIVNEFGLVRGINIDWRIKVEFEFLRIAFGRIVGLKVSNGRIGG